MLGCALRCGFVSDGGLVLDIAGFASFLPYFVNDSFLPDFELSGCRRTLRCRLRCFRFRCRVPFRFRSKLPVRFRSKLPFRFRCKLPFRFRSKLPVRFRSKLPVRISGGRADGGLAREAPGRPGAA